MARAHLMHLCHIGSKYLPTACSWARCRYTRISPGSRTECACGQGWQVRTGGWARVGAVSAGTRVSRPSGFTHKGGRDTESHCRPRHCARPCFDISHPSKTCNSGRALYYNILHGLPVPFLHVLECVEHECHLWQPLRKEATS